MNKLNSGFTLIEIMIAVVILTILSGASLAVLNSSSFRGKANDSQRLGDLRKLQTALELRFSDMRTYPTTSGNGWSIVTTSSPSLTGYISINPVDPAEGRSYLYRSNGSTYTVAAGMETPTGNSKCQIKTGCPNQIRGSCCMFTNP